MRAQGRRLAATAAAVAVAVLLSVLPRPAPRTPGSRTVAAPKRPNIVLVVLDDFSMDLLQTLRSAADDARAGRVVPARVRRRLACAASRGRAPSPGSTPTRPGCAPTSPTRPTRRTRAAATPPSPGSATASARWRCGSRRRATRRGTSASTSTSTSTTPAADCRPTPPGWDDLRVVFGSAYDGWEFYSTRTLDGKPVAALPPGAAGRARSAATKDAAYAGTVIDADALEFIDAHEDDGGAVLPPGGAVRPAQPGQPAAALRRRPALPAGVPRPARARAAGGQLRRRPRAPRSRVKDLPGFARPAGRQPAPPSGRPSSRRPGTDLAGGLPAATAVHLLRTRAQMAQSADRMLTRILEAVGPDTYVILTSDNGFHLGQQGLALGKGTAVHHRRPGAAARRRPRRRARAAARDGQQHRPGARPSRRLAGLATRGVPLRGVARRRASTDRRPRRRDYVFFEHTRAGPSAGRPRPGRRSSTGSRRTSRSAAAPGCWSGSTSTRGAAPATSGSSTT